MNELHSTYSDRIHELEAELAQVKSRLRTVSTLRLALFLVAVGCGIMSGVFSVHFLWLTLVVLYIFGLQVKRYTIISGEAAIVETTLQLNRNELAFALGNKSVFETGADVETTNHIYATDLDIFGKGSLFQSINRTGTIEGKDLVANTLLHLPKDAREIELRTAAIADLANDISWRQRFIALGQMSGEKRNDMPLLRQWVMQQDFFEGRSYWIWIARLCSAISAAFIGWMFWVGAFYPLYFFGLITVNSAILGMIQKSISKYFEVFGSKTKLFVKFSDLFEMVSKRKFNSELGLQHYEKVHEAAGAFRELSQLSNRAENRSNGLVGPVMNGLFMFDIWCIDSIEKWRKKNMLKVDGWIVSLANIDMLNSLSNYKFNHPQFCQPVIVAGPSKLVASTMGHPLLPFEQSIKNDYELGATTRAHIVTGSNMAGKSTFIRTVGLNIVLALNGLPVCAKEFSCTIMSIASCIRITDSLEENASYFRAELNRLQKIVELLKTKEPYIVLLDEILRGTNSDDKRMGTLAFFKKLKDYHCLAILATHDLVIGQLEQQFPDTYANYCFESQLTASELVFDYKLRRGVSTSTNATYLMKSLGLID